MKLIDRIILSIYSLIILVESVIGILLIFGWVKIETIIYIVKDSLNNSVIYNSIFTACIIFIILSLKAILFPGIKNDDVKDNKRHEKMGEGVLLKNEDGKLLISKDTIERLANSVVKNFENIQDARTKVNIDAKNNIAIIIELQILQNTVIKELNEKLQAKIKSVIKEATDLDVDEVNIKIKNIIHIQEKKEEDEEE